MHEEAEMLCRSTPELSAARRRGAIRRLIWPRGRRPRQKGFMHGRRWIGVAMVLLVCALTTAGIAVFSGATAKTPTQSEGNQGVLSLYDFFRVYARNRELRSEVPLGTLTQRLMKEPFDMSTHMTIESQGLKSLGLPLTSVPAEFNMKYDLRDLGVKADVMGLDVFSAYVTESQLIIETAGGEPCVNHLPIKEDVSGDMPLSQRIRAFAPWLPEDTAIWDTLFNTLAQSVPEECTQRRLGRAYSPLDGEDVNVTLIHTEMDEKALVQAADAFAQKLEQDEMLGRQIQTLAAAFSHALGIKDISLELLLARLKDEDFSGICLTWKVFRRDEIPIGFAVTVTTPDAQYDFTRMAEFDGTTSYEHAALFINGSEVLIADYSIQAEDKAGAISAVLHRADGETVSIGGTFALQQYTDNSYRLEADIDAVGKMFRDEQDVVRAAIDARIDFGSGLGMLADSRGWERIGEWKETAPK